MAVIDVEGLTGEVSPDAPCGEDLEYDADFIQLEQAAHGKEAQQMGDAVIEGAGPDWKTVKKLAIGLCGRTKDLRVATYLARALAVTDGLVGLKEGLEVLKAITVTYWPDVHPQLDPDDDNDPTFRVNTYASLIDPDSTLKNLREAPLVTSRVAGSFTLRDIQMASGEIAVPEGVDAPQQSVIDGVFEEMDLDELRASAEAAVESISLVGEIEQFVTEQVGAAQAPDLTDFAEAMKPIQHVLSDQLSRRGVADPAQEAAADAPAAGGAAPAAAAPVPTGEIATREDAIRALDRVISYFNKYEPSSPIPLLLTRAKRLVSKSFMEIMQDLAPDGLAQAQMMGGVDPKQE
jgi:type VI secretion system protein ImpA